jgi:hypothetical protein
MSHKITVTIQMIINEHEIIDNLKDSVEECFILLKDLPNKSFSYSFKSEELPLKLKDITL